MTVCHWQNGDQLEPNASQSLNLIEVLLAPPPTAQFNSKHVVLELGSFERSLSRVLKRSTHYARLSFTFVCEGECELCQEPVSIDLSTDDL